MGAGSGGGGGRGRRGWGEKRAARAGAVTVVREDGGGEAR